MVLAHEVRLRTLAEDAVAAELVRSIRTVGHIIAGKLQGNAFARMAIVLR